MTVCKLNEKPTYKSRLTKNLFVFLTWVPFYIVKFLNLTSTSFSYITLILFLISRANVSCKKFPCERNYWWEPSKNVCAPCTNCPSGMIPIRPCEVHRDTKCGSISDLKIGWIVSEKGKPNWKERRKNGYNHEITTLNQNTDFLFNGHEKEDDILLDWMTTIFFIAAAFCLILFVIAALLLFYHMRQWRKIEESLNNDVEELSSNFLAKLAEVQRIDAGAFLIKSTDSVRCSGFQTHYILLAEKKSKQCPDSYSASANCYQQGNIYIEENGK